MPENGGCVVITGVRRYACDPYHKIWEMVQEFDSQFWCICVAMNMKLDGRSRQSSLVREGR